MLSNAADEAIRAMTNRALDSMYEFKGSNVELKCIVVETNASAKSYEQHWVHTLKPNVTFNYNQFINFGYAFSVGVWPEFFTVNNDCETFVAIGNNDLIYHPPWATELIKGINENNLDSASPINIGWQFHKDFEEDNSRNVFEGWRIGWEFCGWKLLFKLASFKKIYPLDERFLFWCQDNDLALNMHKMNMKHALIKSSKVTHLTSQSHHLIPIDKQYEFTHGQGEVLAQNIKEGKYDK